jgi:hypothetical protein
MKRYYPERDAADLIHWAPDERTFPGLTLTPSPFTLHRFIRTGAVCERSNSPIASAGTGLLNRNP